MRHLSATLLLASALALPTTGAHADTLDDFVVTTPSHIFTFSLPAVVTTIDFDRGGNAVEITTSGTVDGVSGYNIGTASYYTGTIRNTDVNFGLDYYLPGDLITEDDTPPLRGGPYILDITSDIYTYLYCCGGGYADELTLAFQPGTYQYMTGWLYPYTERGTVTITPEATSSPIPEPSTLALLGTGSLALLASLRRSVRR